MQQSKYFFVREADGKKTLRIAIYLYSFDWKMMNVLTLHAFGGTSSCVISPACTQKRCNSAPLYRSHRQTAKSTPPESRCALSYLNRASRRKRWSWKIGAESVWSLLSLPWMCEWWTQQAINSSTMSRQNLMRWPFWIDRKNKYVNWKSRSRALRQYSNSKFYHSSPGVEHAVTATWRFVWPEQW